MFGAVAVGIVTVLIPGMAAWIWWHQSQEAHRQQLLTLSRAHFEHLALTSGQTGLGMYGRYQPPRTH